MRFACGRRRANWHARGPAVALAIGLHGARSWTERELSARPCGGPWGRVCTAAAGACVQPPCPLARAAMHHLLLSRATLPSIDAELPHHNYGCAPRPREAPLGRRLSYTLVMLHACIISPIRWCLCRWQPTSPAALALRTLPLSTEKRAAGSNSCMRGRGGALPATLEQPRGSRQSGACGCACRCVWRLGLATGLPIKPVEDCPCRRERQACMWMAGAVYVSAPTPRCAPTPCTNTARLGTQSRPTGSV